MTGSGYLALSSFLKKPLRLARNLTAELLRRSPVSSEFIGPPKGEYQSFQQFLNSDGSAGAKEQVVFPSEKVFLPAASAVFGPTEDNFLNAESYDSDLGVIYECPNARLFQQPFGIISPDDRLFTFASTWHSSKPRSHFAFHSLRLGRLRRLRGRTLYFGGNSNVWHFYIDCLRQLVLLQAAGRTLEEFDQIIAKHPTTPPEKRFYESLGISKRKLVPPEPGEHLKCDHLTFFATPSGRPGPWLTAHLRKLIFGVVGPQEISPRRRIYISRERAAFRRISNELEITEWLKGRGFEILHLEAMTPDEQISAFRSADVVVGGHGAGLTQILFSDPGSALIEFRNLAFRPENGVSECYRGLSGLLGVNYFTVTSRDAADPNDPHKSDLRVRLDDVKSAVNILTNREGSQASESLCPTSGTPMSSR